MHKQNTLTISALMCATMAGQDKCIRDKGETMAKIILDYLKLFYALFDNV